MSEYKIDYGPNIFQVIRDPFEEDRDIHVIVNLNNINPQIKTIDVILKDEMSPVLRDKFLEFLN